MAEAAQAAGLKKRVFWVGFEPLTIVQEGVKIAMPDNMKWLGAEAPTETQLGTFERSGR